MTDGGNLFSSRYTDCDDEPVTHFLSPITAYREVSTVSLEKSLEFVCNLFNGIESYIWISKTNSQNPSNGLSKDESASIHLFTMEFDSGPSVYQVLNKALRHEDRQSIDKWNSFLKLILTGLEKLPSSSPQTVWRGARGENLCSKYPIGSKFAWWGISLCTSSRNTIEKDIYLGETGLRTLFSIECQNGKLINLHSFFKDHENEIVFMPGTCFQVISHKKDPSKDLFIIVLKEIQPPVPLLQPVLPTPQVPILSKVFPGIILTHSIQPYSI